MWYKYNWIRFSYKLISSLKCHSERSAKTSSTTSTSSFCPREQSLTNMVDVPVINTSNFLIFSWSKHLCELVHCVDQRWFVSFAIQVCLHEIFYLFGQNEHNVHHFLITLFKVINLNNPFGILKITILGFFNRYGLGLSNRCKGLFLTFKPPISTYCFDLRSKRCWEILYPLFWKAYIPILQTFKIRWFKIKQCTFPIFSSVVAFLDSPPSGSSSRDVRRSFTLTVQLLILRKGSL